MRPGSAVGHSPPSSAAVMEEESYTSTKPLGYTGSVAGSLYFLPLCSYICVCMYVCTHVGNAYSMLEDLILAFVRISTIV